MTFFAFFTLLSCYPLHKDQLLKIFGRAALDPFKTGQPVRRIAFPQGSQFRC